MHQPSLGSAVRRLGHWEVVLCLVANRACRWRLVERLFAVVSRLGNGVFWYALMAVLPVVYGWQGAVAALHMGAVGIVGVVVYKFLKTRTLRPRPFAVHAGIRAAAPPLDEFSFPSGHTLHAVSFTLVAVAYVPALAPFLVVFASMVAVSRVLLGLHYPSDVLAGACIGSFIAGLSLLALGG